MLFARTTSANQTRAFAGAVASVVGAGDLLVLSGDLGAGKTTFVQGFARSLGVTDQVTSPTFTLHRQYQGTTLELNHLDVYRLDRLDEVADLGLAELFERHAVAIIEWGDTISAALPVDYLEIRLALGDGEDDRLVELRPVGLRWAARSRALADATNAITSEWLRD